MDPYDRRKIYIGDICFWETYNEMYDRLTHMNLPHSKVCAALIREFPYIKTEFKSKESECQTSRWSTLLSR